MNDHDRARTFYRLLLHNLMQRRTGSDTATKWRKRSSHYSASTADVTSRVEELPGVGAVGTTQGHPLMGSNWGGTVRMVVGQGAKRAVFGLVIGLGLAFAMGGAMSGILIGVSPTDPAIFGGVTFVLAAVSFVGLYLPAQRVSRTDPVQALSAD